MGSDLKPRQYKRIGRIAESNPNRADKVADRMKTRAGREERGRDIAKPVVAKAKDWALDNYRKEMQSNPVREDREMSIRAGAVKNPVKRPKAKFDIPKVSSRPAFAPKIKVKKSKNGASFPDLNKDGKITKADILKGRGVIKNGGKVKKAQAGLTASNKRVGPVDPKGAWTKVQEMNLPPRNVKTKVSLTRDKQLGATKMMKLGGKAKAKKK